MVIGTEREGLLAEFTRRADPLGVRVARVVQSAAGAAWVAAIAAELGAERGVVAEELARTAPNFVAAMQDAGISWELPGLPESTRDAPLGLSLAMLAVAETGSLLVAETTLADRAIGMLAAAQVIVCPTAALVPSLDEAAPLLRAIAARPGGYATLITGPSRTADIERVLTIGVQGPAKVFALFVDELA